MAKRSVSFITCDHCGVEQSSLMKDIPARSVITEIGVHIPGIVASRESDNYLYDHIFTKDLCGNCRTALRNHVLEFFKSKTSSSKARPAKKA